MPPKTILLEPSSCDDKCKKFKELLEETVGKDNLLIIPMEYTLGKNIMEMLRIEDTKSPKLIVITDELEIEDKGGGQDEERNEDKK